MAALQWLGTEELMSLDLSGLSRVHEEALVTLETGAVGRKSAKDKGEWLGLWAKETLKASARPEARSVSLHVLVTTLGVCTLGSLLPAMDRVGQVLLSCLASTAPEPCRRLACVGFSHLVRMVAQHEGAEVEELRQKLLGLLSRVVQLLCTCVRESSSPTTKVAALEAMAWSLRGLRSSVKQHASKVESVALACLGSSSDSDIQSQAAHCLALLPSILGEASRWTALLNRLLQGIHHTLKQVWPDNSQLQSFTRLEGYQELFASPVLIPASPRDYAGVIQTIRWRLSGLLLAIQLLLDEGFAGGPIGLPMASLIDTVEGLMRLHPKASAAMDVADPPISLPSEALQTLVATCRRGALGLLLSLIHAARGQLLRYSSRLSKMVLRAVSWPVDHGLRPAAYSVLMHLVLRLGPAVCKGLVEPCIPLLVHQIESYLKPPEEIIEKAEKGLKSPPSGRNQSSGGKADSREGVKRFAVGEGEEEALFPLQTLSSLILSCGAMIKPEARGEVESLAAGGLGELARGWATPTALGGYRGPLVGGGGGAGSSGYCPLRLHATLRAAFLELVTSLMSCPCPDGATSSTVTLAGHVMDMACLDTDLAVVQAALRGRAMVQALLHPRACPMYVPPSLVHQASDTTAMNSPSGLPTGLLQGRSNATHPTLEIPPREPQHLGPASRPPLPDTSATPAPLSAPVPMAPPMKAPAAPAPPVNPAEQGRRGDIEVASPKKGVTAGKETKSSPKKRPREQDDGVEVANSKKTGSSEASTSTTKSREPPSGKARMTVQEKLPETRQSGLKKAVGGRQEEEEEDDDFLPEIVDIGPDD